MRPLGGKQKPFFVRVLRASGRALDPGILAGLTLSGWLRLLWRVRFRVHIRYWPRALSITLFSLMNSLLGRWENWHFGRQWRNARPVSPLFIVGAPRSGTTFLHNLLCTNPEFAYPGLVECRMPMSFLTLGPLVSKLLPLLFAGRRAQDNVSFGPDVPAEEESALLSKCLVSHQLALVFPHQREQFARYRVASGYSGEEVERWSSAFREFVLKLSGLKSGMLVFKNPANTAKIHFLAQAFPGARFVYIHRHPVQVISSMSHASRKVGPYWRLQSREFPSSRDTAESAGNMIREYLDARSQIEPGRLVEVSYDELSRDPEATVERIYQVLELPGFHHARPSLQAYLGSLGRYRKNRHAALSQEDREWLFQACPEWFTEWGYER